MVPPQRPTLWGRPYFPRIRGDGPIAYVKTGWAGRFSPYSRGWSQRPQIGFLVMHIFPVFAGMVRTRPLRKRICVNFPRIRGDGPILPNIHVLQGEFSPYSRGWSHRNSLLPHARCIFPVFAGMVRRSYGYQSIGSNFPRIRGDGPVSLEMVLVLRAFSPYSRGWSALPVSAYG